MRAESDAEAEAELLPRLVSVFSGDICDWDFEKDPVLAGAAAVGTGADTLMLRGAADPLSAALPLLCASRVVCSWRCVRAASASSFLRAASLEVLRAVMSAMRSSRLLTATLCSNTNAVSASDLAMRSTRAYTIYV
jgi:hypothetical protein